MNEFDVMSHKEKIALTTEEITRLCDYECAKNGVKLMTMPIEPEKKTFKADTFVYKALDYHTQDREIAEKIVSFFADIRPHLVKLDYNYRLGSENKYIEKNLDEWDARPEIQKLSVFSAETFRTLRGELESYNDKMNTYKSEKQEWEKNEEKRTKETEWIRLDISAHNRLEAKFEEYQRQWERYIDLANGDQTIARNFFKKSLTEEERGPVAEYIEKRLAADFFDEKEETEMCEKAVNEIRQYW